MSNLDERFYFFFIMVYCSPQLAIVRKARLKFWKCVKFYGKYFISEKQRIERKNCHNYHCIQVRSGHHKSVEQEYGRHCSGYGKDGKRLYPVHEGTSKGG